MIKAGLLSDLAGWLPAGWPSGLAKRAGWLAAGDRRRCTPLSIVDIAAQPAEVNEAWRCIATARPVAAHSVAKTGVVPVAARGRHTQLLGQYTSATTASEHTAAGGALDQGPDSLLIGATSNAESVLG